VFSFFSIFNNLFSIGKPELIFDLKVSLSYSLVSHCQKGSKINRKAKKGSSVKLDVDLIEAERSFKLGKILKKKMLEQTKIDCKVRLLLSMPSHFPVTRRIRIDGLFSIGGCVSQRKKRKKITSLKEKERKTSKKLKLVRENSLNRSKRILQTRHHRYITILQHDKKKHINNETNLSQPSRRQDLDDITFKLQQEVPILPRINYRITCKKDQQYPFNPSKLQYNTLSNPLNSS